MSRRNWRPSSNNLSIKNGVLLYKQLIRPMVDYACPVWRSAARSRIKKLQVLQSKCLRIATIAPWYTGNRYIHDDLRLPYFSDHIIYERFDSKLADVGNPLLEELGRHLRKKMQGSIASRSLRTFKFLHIYIYIHISLRF